MEPRWPRPSLSPDLLLEFAEELWFYSSVIPSIYFPCFSALLSSLNSSPDSSTLLAQLMLSTTRHRPALSSSPSPFSPSWPPLQQPLSPPVDSWDLCLYEVPSEYESSGGHNHEGYYSVNLAGTSYGSIKDQIYSWHAHSDEDTEHVVDGEDFRKEGDCKQELDVPENVSSNHEGVVDALSGLFDVGVLLKGQQYSSVDGDTHEFGREDMLDDMLPMEWPKMTDAHSVEVDQKSKDMKASTDVEACGEDDSTCGVPFVGKGSSNQDNSLIVHANLR